jgi:AcrR family transcriptional regulator
VREAAGVPERARRPRQQRSRATVERLLDATALVLERDGYHAASTNRIAREAGASPGSVYQYFADKDDLVAGVARRFVGQFTESLAPALRYARPDDPATSTRLLIEAILDVLEAQAGLLRTLVERVPTIEQDNALQAIRARLGDVVHQILAIHRDELRHGDLDRLTWTMVELAQQLPVRYVLDRPAITREDFVADTVRTILLQAFDVVPPVTTRRR